MTHYVTSTHTNSIQYVEFDNNCNKNHNVIKKRFVIQGGHGLANKHFITPEGVVTRVESDEDMEWLMGLPTFQKHIKKGFIRVMKRKEDPEKTVKRDMQDTDGSSPKTPKDYIKVEGAENTYRAFGSMV